LTGWRRLSPV